MKKTKDELFEALITHLFEDNTFQINESELSKELLGKRKDLEFPVYERKEN